MSADLFLDAEKSNEDSAPAEIYEISYNTTTLRYTSGTSDVIVGGVLYRAIPMTRNSVTVVQSNDKQEFAFTVPIDNPLVRRYLQSGVPPRRISVIVSRLQKTVGLVERLWSGYVTSMSVNDACTEASFTVPGHLGSNLLRVIPNITAGRRCPYTLYSELCTVGRDGSGPTGLAYKVATTAMSVNGRDVRVDLGSTDRNGFWAANGELVHVASGERMTIRAQTDINAPFSAVADLSMQFAISGMNAGDAIEVYAGCDWLISTCNGRFGNKDNFGGFNRLPSRQVFAQSLGGFGDVTSGEL